ncbi:MAG: hypothetical protein VX899_07835 [Myxococcota bacterium]|nr:hypothetical protein [Myxococcota bacterium]
MTLLLMLSPLASAEPDHFATSLAAGVGDGAVLAPGAELMAWRSGAQIVILDTQTWETTAADACEGDAALAAFDLGTAWAFYAGCDDGTISVVQIEDDQKTVSVQDSLSPGTLEILAVGTSAASGAQLLYVIEESEDGNPLVYTLDPDSGDAGDATTLGVSGVSSTLMLSNYWLILHGGRQVSKVDLNTGSPSVFQEGGGSQDLDRACTFTGTAYAFAANSAEFNGGITLLQPGQINAEYSVALDMDTPFSAVACSTSTEDNTADDNEWIASYSEDGYLELWERTNLTLYSTAVQGFDVDELGVVSDLYASPGYLLAQVGSDLHVFTEHPWLSLSVDNSEYSGGSFGFTASSDTDGDWKLYLGAETGDVLASGTFTAGEDAEFTLDGEDLPLDEGLNRFFLVQEGGRVAVDVNVDNPPLTPELSLSFGDQSVVVQIGANTDPDLSSYTVYLSTESFDASTAPESGDILADTELDAYQTFTLSELDASSGDAIEIEIEGVNNYVTYYVGVTATDESGNESPMSEILDVTPEPTFSAAQLAGEQGGFGCNSGAGGASLMLGLGAGLVALARRRKRWGLGALLLASSPALAQETAEDESLDEAVIADGEQDGPHAGWTAKSRYNALRIGSAQMDGGNSDSNDAWEQVYDSRLPSVQLHGGYQLYRFLELDGHVGVMRKGGSQAVASTETTDTEDDSSSSSTVTTGDTKMTVLPVGVGVTLRLDPFLPHRQIGDEFYGMPVVPWFNVSLDYYPWLERKGDLDVADLTGFDALAGGKAGWSYAYGVDILLDWMDPKRASLVWARYGIEDTYLSVSYRKSTLFQDEGLSFAGDTISVGLKIDRR